MKNEIQQELRKISKLMGREITLEELINSLPTHSDYEILILVTGARIGMELGRTKCVECRK